MKRYIILSAEDSDADFLLIRLAVEKLTESLNLCRVLDGEEALSFLLRSGSHVDAPRPDLILLDANMPKKDGFEVLEEIQRHESLKTIPVVMLTSLNSSKDQRRALSLGASGFVTKAADADGFLRDLQRHLPPTSQAAATP